MRALKPSYQKDKYINLKYETNHEKENMMDAEKQAKAEAIAAKAKEKALRPWFKKKRFWALGIIGLIIIGSATSQGGSSTTNSDSSDGAQTEEVTTDTAVDAGSSSENETVSQENARESAESYWRYSAFSRSGLMGPLEFEDYSTADATYAVDVLDVDWNEQAAKSAASYLESSSFSRQGLIDQLLFEGFSQSEAEYGVGTTGL